MTQMEQFLSSITSHSGDLFSTMSEDKGNDADLLVQIFDQALSRIGVSVSDMNKQDRFSLVALLKEQDYFRLQKSVRYVAEQLNVSKYTIYKYLKELDAMSESIFYTSRTICPLFTTRSGL